jgi:alpha/beta superfamily hydrolase
MGFNLCYKGKNMKKLCLIAFALLLTTVHAQTVGFMEIPSRAGVKQPFLYSKAASPVAAAILFQGGAGRIGAAGSATNGWARVELFLSGGARRFTDNDITVAIFDNPSDRGDLNSGFRNAAEHNQDVAALIAFLRKENPGLPVWLIGNSNGTLSVTSAAANLGKAGPDGIVLSSSVSVEHSLTGQKFTHPYWAAKLDQIAVPVLISHHKDDVCEYSPYAAMQKALPSFSKSLKVEMITMEGGATASGNSCGSGPHQYQGIEVETTKKIADWIKVNQPTAR